MKRNGKKFENALSLRMRRGQRLSGGVSSFTVSWFLRTDFISDSGGDTHVL